MRIDVHAHYFPGKYLELLERFGSKTTNEARNRGAGTLNLPTTPLP